MAIIDPLRDLRDALRLVEKPARYVGGEYGRAAVKEGPGILRVAVSYPDLYEIGMSNSAIKILYSLLNGVEGVSCERVFAAAPDFEAELRARRIPLYSLESGRELSSFDVVGFSLGFELTFTNMLSILDLGGISLLAEERGDGEPIVMAGGPAGTNPAPYGSFLDCMFIGEAEGWAEETFGRLAGLKRRGAGRQELLSHLRSLPSIWYADKPEPTRRALWRGFSTRPARTGFPVPSVRIVQDHGTVEIMRGCPNACRFCHATCFYRPTRSKDPERIVEETAELVLSAGYREITLASLSSGEYAGIRGLVERLNSLFPDRKVSFSMPSLHVDSLGLSMLKEISEVRKSGLTFAVETPKREWQESIGKSVPIDKTIEILREARSLGWKSAKFYFMVGLPASFSEDEAAPIVEFLREVRAATGVTIHANVASFIPKPHTPFERLAQLPEVEALERITTVRKGLKGDGFKIGYHAPFLSLLEGIVSRGDRRAGMLVLEAYERGARLDAWEEYIRADIWRDVIAGARWEVEAETCRMRGEEELLPWQSITLGISQCVSFEAGDPASSASPVSSAACAGPRGIALRVLFSFTKKGKSAYISHLDIMTVFERAIARSGYLAVFSQGFNPKPRLEFASPLGLGIESEEEIAGVELSDFDSEEGFAQRMNGALPEGISVTRVGIMAGSPSGKKPSLMAFFWGSEYILRAAGPGEELPDIAGVSDPAWGEEVLTTRTREGLSVRVRAGGKAGAVLSSLRRDRGISLRRTRCFAKGSDAAPSSYFDLFCSSSLI